MKMYLNLLYS